MSEYVTGLPVTHDRQNTHDIHVPYCWIKYFQTEIFFFFHYFLLLDLFRGYNVTGNQQFNLS